MNQQDEYTTAGSSGPLSQPPTTGLVSECISAQAVVSRLVLCPGGLDIRTRGRPCDHVPGAPRGVIRGLSPAARRRLLRTLIRICWPSGGSSHICLTYHHGYTGDPRQWHGHLHAFLHEVTRAYGQFEPEWVWVLEAQKRGAPHFHLLVLWGRAPHPIQLRNWVARTWHRIADPDSLEHARAGTRVDAIPAGDRAGIRKLQSYLTKYFRKDDQKAFIDQATGEVLPSGRMWGHSLNKLLVELQSVPLQRDVLATLLRRLRSWGRKSHYLRLMGKRYTSGVVLGESERLGQLLRGLVPDTS